MFASLASSDEEDAQEHRAEQPAPAPLEEPLGQNGLSNGKKLEWPTPREEKTAAKQDGVNNCEGDADEELCAYLDSEYGARQWRLDHGVTVKQASGAAEQLLHRPILSFRKLVELGVDAELVQSCIAYLAGGGRRTAPTPTAVQAEVWGALLLRAGNQAELAGQPSLRGEFTALPFPSASSWSAPLDPKVRETFKLAQTIPVPSDTEDEAERSTPQCGTSCKVRSDVDLIAVAPTGSGKTLAYLLPFFAEKSCLSRGSLARASDLASCFEDLFTRTFATNEANKAIGARFAKLRHQDEAQLMGFMSQIAQRARAMSGKKDALLLEWSEFEGDCALLDVLRPRVLVIVPTRELAFQVFSVAAALDGFAAAVVGGVDPDRQRESLLNDAPSLLVATPGRLCALCGHTPSSSRSASRGADAVGARAQRSVALAEVHRLVMDEGDRLLDEGFCDDVTALASRCQAGNRHTMLFSATWSSALSPLAAILRGNSIMHVNVAGLPSTIVQDVEVLPRVARSKRLKELLAEFGQTRVLVFVLYKKEARSLAKMLRDSGWDATALQGDMSQAARTTALRHFRAAESAVLVATDVAARGIDISGVHRVVNFSFPLSIDTYIHRIGRCGRAGSAGTAVSFVTDGDERHAADLLRLLKEAKQQIPPGLEDMALAVRNDSGASLSITHSGRRGEVKVVRKKR
mmetsp:Transcript_48156/g.112622  ORF Transcript_48156/g.112622 Transcript_48156/m.112622 type:complete len:689 (+) Transcript_48156:78-2144(+)